MKRITAVLLGGVALLFSSCLEIGQSTTINEDGSGMTLFTIDLSALIKNAQEEGRKTFSGEGGLKIDTTIHVRDLPLDMEGLTADQRRLVKEMIVKPQLNVTDKENPKFSITLVSSFGNPDDLNALTAMMQTPAFTGLMDKVIATIPGFETGGSGMGEVFQMASLPFYKTTYQKGRIDCVVDTTTEIYEALIRDEKIRMNIKEMEADQSKSEDFAMAAKAKFIKVITLPSAAKEIKGAAKKGNSDREIKIEGNMLDLLKDPKQYEYSLSY